MIRVQQPLPIGPWTDSIPDIAVVRGNPRDFDSHPTCALIVIEVAGTALAIELGEKANAYAAANLADYWVLDLNAQQLLVFRDPIADAAIATGFRYATKLTLEPTDSISPLAAPQAVIRVADLLP